MPCWPVADAAVIWPWSASEPARIDSDPALPPWLDAETSTLAPAAMPTVPLAACRLTWPASATDTVPWNDCAAPDASMRAPAAS